MYHRRHHDDELIDEVHITCVPRFKTSYISGDEWRVSYEVELKKKGDVLYTKRYNKMDSAVAHLAWLMRTFMEQSSEEIPGFIQHINREKNLCAQVGCPEEATVFFKLKRLTAKNGSFLDMTDEFGNYMRGFCEKHKKRGNSDREDNDQNYESL